MTRLTPCWRPAALAAGLPLLILTAAACSSPEGPTPPPVGPTITCPADISAVSNDGSSVPVTYTVPTAVGGSTPVNVVCAPPSGSSFQPGSTAVTCTATDASSRTATCGFSVKVSVPARLKLTKFMAFGDSLTEGKQSSVGPLFKLANFPGSYPDVLYSLLVARYTAQAPTMSRQGLGGETTSAGVVRLQGLLTTQRPEVLLLMEGANDLSGGDSTMIAPASRNMDQMVVNAKGAGATVFLATLPPQRPGGVRAGGAGLVGTYNSQMKSIAALRAATLVDTNAALSADVASYVGPDGLHLTTAGYQKMADTFLSAIQATLEIPGSTPSATASSPLGTRILDEPAFSTQHSAHVGSRHSGLGTRRYLFRPRTAAPTRPMTPAARQPPAVRIRG